ncbi:MAG: hypothetical protein IKB13_09370 [Clostridia bacterium]|nr:hypothetical protein [Clostridia bacterium]
MKKHISKIIAIVCLIAMMSAMAACTQTIQIAFVDANGDVYNPFENIGTGTVNVYAPGGSSNGGSSAPATNPPAQDTTTPPPAADDTTAPAADDTTAAPADATPSGVPSTKEEIIAFYKAAADKVKKDGAAGYTKKEWQFISEINIGADMINSAVEGVVAGFMTTEDEAGEQINDKGTDDAKNRFPEFTLTDYSFIVSAECTTNAAGNYVIKMVCADEDTPRKDGSSKLGQVTQSLIYWEDLEKTLKEDPTVTKILTAYDGVHVIYTGYTVTAEITPDGQFVSMDHVGNIHIEIGSAKILIATIKDKSANLTNTCKYYNFNY